MLRIIAGKHRGRKLEALPGKDIRPTGGRARAALFNILEHAHFNPRPVFEDAIVLDAFAGTGALGLEALSRGARYCSFMESDRAARAVLEANIAAAGEQGSSNIIATDALSLPRSKSPASLVLLDPPYALDIMAEVLAVLSKTGWLLPEAIAVAELPAKRAFTPPADFSVLDTRRYGAAQLVFLRYAPRT